MVLFSPYTYYNYLIKRKYTGLERKNFKLRSSFIIKLLEPSERSGIPYYDVPTRRFNLINEKLREFPVKELGGHTFSLTDFNDGFGQTYAYQWKNTQGTVGYYMKFDVDNNITIPRGSSVNSGSTLFAANGDLKIIGSNIVNCVIYAIGELSIIGCTLRDCYISAKGKLIGVQAPVRSKFIGEFDISGLTLSGNHF